MQYVKMLGEIGHDDLALVGRKALDLVLLREQRFAVPQSFVILSNAFEAIVRENNLKAKIDFLLQHVSVTDAQSLMNAYTSIRRAMGDAKLPQGLEAELRELFESVTAKGVGLDGGAEPARVIVSLNWEEDPENNDTIVQNAQGFAEFLTAVREAFALAYVPSQLRDRLGMFPEQQLKVALLIEAMASAQASVHAYSAVPQDHGKVYLQVYYGHPDLRERIVKDYYAIDKNGLHVVASELSVQPSKLEIQGKDLTLVPLPARAKDDKLNRRELEEIARLTKKAQQVLGAPAKLVFAVMNERYELLWAARMPFTANAEQASAQAVSDVPAAPAERAGPAAISPTMEIVDIEPSPGAPSPVDSAQASVPFQEPAKEAIEQAGEAAEQMERQIVHDAAAHADPQAKLLAATLQLAMRTVARKYEQIYGQTGDDFGSMVEQLSGVGAFARPIDVQLLRRAHDAVQSGAPLSTHEFARAAEEITQLLA